MYDFANHRFNQSIKVLHITTKSEIFYTSWHINKTSKFLMGQTAWANSNQMLQNKASDHCLNLVQLFLDISTGSILTLVMLNKLRRHAHFQFSASQITWSRLLTQIHILNDKQCRSRSVGFWRSQLIWIYTVCKGRACPGSAGQGLNRPVQIFGQVW